MSTRERNIYNTRTSYIEGNVAHQLNMNPERIRREQPSHIPDQRRRTRQKEVKEIGISFKSLLVLTMAIVATLYVCTGYLKQHSDVKAMENNIFRLEEELNHLVNKNNYNIEKINTKLDLNNIYEIAVGELGMVFPNNNETITYNRKEKDIVIQYKEIPKIDDNAIESTIKYFITKND
ncbi:MAG TPA: hypothetical protein GXZ90_04030 [Clostridiales bacterium]|nr:hypothetical protein [Clostridiales bacterium]